MMSATEDRSPWNGRTAAWTASMAQRKAAPSSAISILLRTRPRSTLPSPARNKICPETTMPDKPLNAGIIGGGKGGFIVHAHDRAIHFDGTRRVVAAALSSNPKIALAEAAKWPYPIKGYSSYDQMIAANARLPDNQKLDYIVIVTPNDAHYDPAMKAMKAGIAVFCEKPLCLNLKEAETLVKTARGLNIPFGVSHTYVGYWMSRLSRYIVRSGLLGEIRWVDSYYIQGWLATRLETTGHKGASWRLNPKRAGVSNCGGDIGTHALMQLRYVTGLEITEL